MKYYDIQALYLSKRYKFFTSGVYNLNIFGIRSKDRTADLFNDIIGAAYTDEFNQKQLLTFKATTDPGAYWLGSRMGNFQGTGILIPGQYFSAFKLGIHKGKYPALTQSEKAKFKVWRDSDQDGKLDLNGKIYDDISGLNLHTTSFINNIKNVGAYSAGCQVIQNDKDFLVFMAIINRSAEIYGDYFTYTLFDENTNA